MVTAWIMLGVFNVAFSVALLVVGFVTERQHRRRVRRISATLARYGY